MMESIEKLREWSHRYDNEWIQEDESIVITTDTHGVYYGKNYGESIRAMIDAIECEIAERYILLPVDVRGVPIRVGDTLECHASGYDGKFEVFAVGTGVVIGNHDIEFVTRHPTDWFHIAKYCRHVKPRTIEDVLREFILDADCVVCGCGDSEADMTPEEIEQARDTWVAKYAAELRELMGSDGE